MSYYNNNEEIIDNKKNNSVDQFKPQYSSLYIITHSILLFFAIYLSWRCNSGVFDPLNFLFAIFCPHLYIIWALATRGGCGVFEGVPIIKT